MTITSVDTDHDSLTITLTADFDHPIEEVWELWSDPRKLERWWGPPGYPAAVDEHDLRPGGEVAYVMTGPDGETHRGVWQVIAVDRPTALEFADAFADADGARLADAPITSVGVRLIERDRGTRMEMRMRFETREDMERIAETGTVEGLTQAVSQMDGLLAPRP